MVVRETPSLADSLELLLETVGFRVVAESTVPDALARLADPRDEPVRAVVIACNLPRSEMLRSVPEQVPEPVRSVPVLVVGDRAAGSRQGWPTNVRFVGLPFEARAFVDLLDSVTSVREPLVGAIGVDP